MYVETYFTKRQINEFCFLTSVLFPCLSLQFAFYFLSNYDGKEKDIIIILLLLLLLLLLYINIIIEYWEMSLNKQFLLKSLLKHLHVKVL